MGDVYFAIVVMSVAASAGFLLGIRLAGGMNSRHVASLAIVACAVTVASATVLRDSLLMTRVLPFADVIVLGNWVLPATAFLAGIAWRRMPGHAVRKAVLLLPLLLLCVYQSYGWLLTDVPPLDGRWKDGVCRQTSGASCSAAAAATLLRAHGIDATEAEMARLCLTRAGGTPMLGLYRGLKLKTARTGLTVRAFRGDLAALRTVPGPVILSVRLDPARGTDPRYERLWGWAPGVSHTVVLLGFDQSGIVEVGDPSVGREQWSVRDLEVLWHGEGLIVERRVE